MSHQRLKQGFTLIELLVVIAIIAILAAILFPVFAQARESARTTSCVSNEKQITLGILMYVQDYDETFPDFYYDTPSNAKQVDPNGGGYLDGHFGWDEACQPYIKNKGLLFCPSASNPGNDYFGCAGATSKATCPNPDKHDSDWTGSLNYSINCRMTGWIRDKSNNQVRVPTEKLASLSYPASTILLSENGDQGSMGSCRVENNEWGWAGDQTQALTVQATGQQPAPLARHKGGANYAYSDGHAKWINANSLGLTKNAQGQPVANSADVYKIMDASGTRPTYHLNEGN